MQHSFRDAKHLDQGLSAQFEPILTDSLKEHVELDLVCLEQVLTRDQIEYSSNTGIGKICLFVAIPETSHQEIVLGKKSVESFPHIDKPLFQLYQ